jgi:molybdopterin-binding protein
MSDFENEAVKLTELLKGKVVKTVRRNRNSEVMIEFDDGTRLFVNMSSERLEFSVTG